MRVNILNCLYPSKDINYLISHARGAFLQAVVLVTYFV